MGALDRQASEKVLCLRTACCSWTWAESQTLSLARNQWSTAGTSRALPSKETEGLETKYALERGEARGGLLGGIMCILGPREEAVPAVLVVMAVRPEIPPNLLYLPLSLAVCVGVISGGQAYRDTKELEESLPDMGDELWPTVGDNVLRDAEIAEDVMKQRFGSFQGCWKTPEEY